MESFQIQMEEICEGIMDNAQKIIEVEAPKIARKAVTQLRKDSPVNEAGNRAGRYARGWRYETDNGETWIYNATDWQLTHLLEDGHDIKSRFTGDRVVGHYGGVKHILYAEQLVIRELPVRVSRGLY